MPKNVFCRNSDSTKQIYRIEKVVYLNYFIGLAPGGQNNFWSWDQQNFSFFMRSKVIIIIQSPDSGIFHEIKSCNNHSISLTFFWSPAIATFNLMKFNFMIICQLTLLSLRIHCFCKSHNNDLRDWNPFTMDAAYCDHCIWYHLPN